MTRRHPHDAQVTNPNHTAPPRRRPGHQSQSHSAAQTTPWSPIPMTRRHPDHALVSNPNDTAPPTPPAMRMAQRHPRHQQCAWRSATHATRTPAIRMAQRHPRDTLTSHPHGTAPPTRPAHQPSACHSATHATHTPAIRMEPRRPAAGETRTPSSKKQHTTGEQPETARTGPHRPAQHTPPTIDLRPLKVIPRFDFFLHPQLLQLPNSYSSATLATRTPATPTRN